MVASIIWYSVRAAPRLLLFCGFAPGSTASAGCREPHGEALRRRRLVAGTALIWHRGAFTASSPAEPAAPPSWGCLSFVSAGRSGPQDIYALLRSFRVRRAVLVMHFCSSGPWRCWRSSGTTSGLGWGGDWLEHFQRSLFFLHRFPRIPRCLGGFELPARRHDERAGGVLHVSNSGPL